MLRFLSTVKRVTASRPNRGNPRKFGHTLDSARMTPADANEAGETERVCNRHEESPALENTGSFFTSIIRVKTHARPRSRLVIQPTTQETVAVSCTNGKLQPKRCCHNLLLFHVHTLIYTDFGERNKARLRNTYIRMYTTRVQSVFAPLHKKQPKKPDAYACMHASNVHA